MIDCPYTEINPYGRIKLGAFACPLWYALADMLGRSLAVAKANAKAKLHH